MNDNIKPFVRVLTLPQWVTSMWRWGLTCRGEPMCKTLGHDTLLKYVYTPSWPPLTIVILLYLKWSTIVQDASFCNSWDKNVMIYVTFILVWKWSSWLDWNEVMKIRNVSLSFFYSVNLFHWEMSFQRKRNYEF